MSDAVAIRLVVDAAAAWLVAGKQAANGLCNTLIAKLIWIALGRYLAPRRVDAHGIAAAPLLFNLLVAFTLILGLAIVGPQMHESQQRIIAGLEQSLHDRVEHLRRRYGYLLGSASQQGQVQLAEAVTAAPDWPTAQGVLARIAALRAGDAPLVQDPWGGSAS